MRAAIAVSLFLTLACDRPEEPPAAADPPAAPPADSAAPHDEAAIIERTKKFVEAVDSDEADTLPAMLADGFMHVLPGRFGGADLLLSRLRTRKQQGYPRYRDRKYDETEARFYGDSAIVTTTSSVTVVRGEGIAPGVSVHTMTFVWSWQGGVWRLTTWNEADAGREMDRTKWNRTYSQGGSFNPAPNRLLVDTVHGRKPGKALDLGIGQGRNAIYLASQGWEVTGVDIADEGIARVNEAAKAAGLDAKVHAEVADLNTWDLGTNQYDLIAFIYMGPTPPVDDIRRALEPGGIVVFEHFGADVSQGAGGLRQGDLTALFADGFEVLRDEAVVDVADWGNARVPLIRFVAEKKR